MSQRSTGEVDGIIGGKIRIYRKAAKMSQSELAQRLGVTYQQVQKYENGTDRVSAARLYMVAQTLGVPVTDFFAEADADVAGESGGLNEALRMSEFIRIGAKFSQIQDPAMRKSIADLVETVAEAGRRE